MNERIERMNERIERMINNFCDLSYLLFSLGCMFAQKKGMFLSHIPFPLAGTHLPILF